MKIESIQCRAFRIKDAPALDPITIIVRETDRGQGQMIIECYGQSWVAFWGSMGSNTVIQFVAGCGVDYLLGCFRPAKFTKKQAEYLTRVLTAVKAACVEIENFGSP